METLIGKGVHEKTAELEALIANGMFYFRRAVDLYGEHPRVEVRSRVWPNCVATLTRESVAFESSSCSRFLPRPSHVGQGGFIRWCCELLIGGLAQLVTSLPDQG